MAEATGCNVCIAGYDGDAPRVYNPQVVKARKAHRCYECKRVIATGATYECITGLWDDWAPSHDAPSRVWSTYRFCADCSAIAYGLSCDGTRSFGNLWEDIEENLFPEMTIGCLANIGEPSAKAYLIQRWQEWKGLRARTHA
jgi:hypothetical protein